MKNKIFNVCIRGIPCHGKCAVTPARAYVPASLVEFATFWYIHVCITISFVKIVDFKICLDKICKILVKPIIWQIVDNMCYH